MRPSLAEAALPARLRFVLFRDIEAAPRKECLIERLLGVGEASAFAGAPGSGKSVLAGDIACHVAAGLPWLGRRVRQGGVLYIAAERAKLTERRFAAFRKHHGVDDLPLALISGSVDFLSSQRHAEEVRGHASALRQSFGKPVSLIVIDTVSRVLAGGDENSPKDMGAFVANIGHLQEAIGAHILLIHHVPQAEGNVRLRGHGALLGALDTVLAIEKGSAIRTATVIKDNDGADEQAFAFRLESIPLSIDPDTLEETTAPIVVAAEGAPIRQAKAPLGGAAKKALQALHEAIDEFGETPSSSQIPRNVPKTVSKLHWRQRAYSLGVSDSDKVEAKEAAFRRAYNALLKAERIGVWEDSVWPV